MSTSKPRSKRAHLPRIVCYHQTHFHNGQFISMLPLLRTGVTHIILAAIHLNEQVGDITLNNDPFESSKNDLILAELKTVQDSGVKVLGMLGGAAKGTYTRLDQDDESFVAFYEPLRDIVKRAGFDGLDLDVEEEMSLDGILRLIDRLKEDFGQDFLITLAPVATALQGKRHISGFDHRELEELFGVNIAWYNVQFYNGWGWVHDTRGYEEIISQGWSPEKVVLGMTTSPHSARGWCDDENLCMTLLRLINLYPNSFGGVMGWEYFNSFTNGHPPGEHDSWAKLMTVLLRPADMN